MPRLYREAPLASIWEGSGNVMSLDVLRALTRAPRSLEVLPGRGRAGRWRPTARLDARVKDLKDQFADPSTLETRARRVVEGMALCLQGSLLVRHAPAAVADAFCASRLGGDGGLEYGTLPAGSDFEAIIARGRPRLRRRTAAPRLRGLVSLRLPFRYGAADQLSARPHLRHQDRRGLQLVRRAVLLHPRRHALLPRSARGLAHDRLPGGRRLGAVAASPR